MATYIASYETPDVSAGGYVNRKLETTGYTAGSQTVSLAVGVTNYVYLFTDPDVPGTSGSAGIYVAEVNITTAAATSGGTIYGSAAINRVAASGTVQTSSAFTAEQSFGSTGVKTFSITASAIGSFAAGERIRLDIKYRNSHPSLARTATWYMGTTNSELVAPDASSPPTYVTATAATVNALGQTASLIEWRAVPSVAATVAVLGQTATVVDSAPSTPDYVTATAATVNALGQSATLRQTTLIPATPGTVVTSGQTATLRQTTLIPASAGTVVANGQTATVVARTHISATPATVVASGQTASLLQTTLIPASAGTVVVTGTVASVQDATPATIEATAATVLASGQTATLRQTTLIPASAGTVVAAGQSATLRQTTLIPASAGTVVTSGQTASITETSPTLRIECSAGTVVASGQTASITEATPAVPTSIEATAATVVVVGGTATVSAAGGISGRRVRRYRTKVWHDAPAAEPGTPSSSVDGLSGQLIPEFPPLPLPEPTPLWREKPTETIAVKRVLPPEGFSATVVQHTRIPANVARIGVDPQSMGDSMIFMASRLQQIAKTLPTRDAKTLRRFAKFLQTALPELDELDDIRQREEDEIIALLLSSRVR